MLYNFYNGRITVINRNSFISLFVCLFVFFGGGGGGEGLWLIPSYAKAATVTASSSKESENIEKMLGCTFSEKSFYQSTSGQYVHCFHCIGHYAFSTYATFSWKINIFYILIRPAYQGMTNVNFWENFRINQMDDPVQMKHPNGTSFSYS